LGLVTAVFFGQQETAVRDLPEPAALDDYSNHRSHNTQY